MTTPNGAMHRDLEQRLRDLERQVRELSGAALGRRQLGLDRGDFVVEGGGSVRVKDAGGLSVEHQNGREALGVTQLTYDGSTAGKGMLMEDENGRRIFTTVGRDRPDLYRWAFNDSKSDISTVADANSGFGLGLPRLPGVLYERNTAGGRPVSTGAWDTTHQGTVQVVSRYLHIGLMVNISGTQAAVRVETNGSLAGGGAGRILTSGGFHSWVIRKDDRFRLHQQVNVEVQARIYRSGDVARIAPWYMRFDDSP